MKSKLLNFVAVDFGSSKIAAIAAHVDKKYNTQILSHKIHNASGIKAGVITDLALAQASVINTIYAIEEECDKNIKKVTVTISGAGAKSHYITHKLKTSGQPITTQELNKLLQKMISAFATQDQEIIHYFPVEFIIDTNNIVDNPIGMVCKELSCRMHIITVNTTILANIFNCFAKSQIAINSIALAVYTTAIACLTNDEKNLGAMVIDIGAYTTSIGVFWGDKLIYSNYIDLGSWYITYDIANVFSISMHGAEKLKVLYGSAIESEFEQDKLLRNEDFEPDNQYNPNLVITQKQLTSVICARMEEILLMLKAQCDDAVIDYNSIARSIVITGGGSELKFVKELTSTIFKKPVRIGKPDIAEPFTNSCNIYAYSAALGALMMHAQTNASSNKLDTHHISDNGWLQKTITWIKTNI